MLSRQSDPTSFLRIHTLYTKGLQALRLVFIRRYMSLRLRVVLRIARAITTENGKVRFTIFWATTRSAPLSCRYSLTSRTRRKVHLHRHRGRSAFEPFVRLEIEAGETLFIALVSRHRFIQKKTDRKAYSLFSRLFYFSFTF